MYMKSHLNAEWYITNCNSCINWQRDLITRYSNWKIYISNEAIHFIIFQKPSPIIA